MLLDLLRTRSEPGNIGRAAFRALLHARPLKTAVVTDQPVVFVQRQRNVAVRALDDRSAGPAGYKPRHAAPVEKENGLLSPLKPVLQQLLQPFRQDRAVSVSEFLPQIRDLHRWKRSPRQSFRQGIELIYAGLGSVIRFKGWRRTSKHNTGVLESSQLFRHFPCVIFRHRFIFITALVLLVNYDNAELRKRSKQSTPGTDDHVDLPSPGALPLIRFLALGERRVHHRHSLTKIAVEPQQCLVGQRDLGNEHDCFLSPGDDSPDDRDIDLCLAASGDAVDQAHRALSRVVVGQNAVHYCLLRFAEFLPVLICLIKQDRIAEGLLLGDSDHTGRRHRPDHRGGNMQLSGDQAVGLSRNFHKFPEETLSCDLMLSDVNFQLLLRFLPGESQFDLSGFDRFSGLSRCQNSPQGRSHRGSIPALHPGGKRDRGRSVVIFAVAAVIDRKLGDLLHLLRRQVALVFKGDHIPFAQHISIAERHQNKAPGLQYILHPLGNPVRERPVQFVIGDVNDDLRVSAQILCFSPQASSRISLIRTLSSMGYLWPLISW